jgi:hypothetical protein
MSVIFKTLEKLRHDTRQGEARASRSRKSGDIYTFKRIAFSLVVLFGLGLFIILFGLAALYGVWPLGSDIERGETQGAPFEASAGVPGSIPSRSSVEPFQTEEMGPLTQKLEIAQEVPPAPTHIPVEVVSKGGVSSKETAPIRYLPPGTPMEPDQHDYDTASPGGIQATNPSAVLVQTLPESEHIHLANVEKTVRITRMVSKIQRAMLSEDNTQVETLIDELVSIKGEKNVYISKLKAYWHLRQEDYEAAATVLNSVLQKNENDFEAGVNMAVLEIRTHQLDQARSRLQRLRQVYQDNTLIPALLIKTRK